MDTKAARIPLEMEKPVVPPADPTAEGTAPVDLEEKIVAALRTCYDPEIPVNIYEMGLIYDIAIQPAGTVDIRMTLTSPACPAAGSLPGDVQAKVRAIPGVSSVKVDIVWDPPWTPDRMSDAAKLQLGFF
jgi:FeS assembly SUF system protein